LITGYDNPHHANNDNIIQAQIDSIFNNQWQQVEMRRPLVQEQVLV
jgi:hypothetical protein